MVDMDAPPDPAMLANHRRLQHPMGLTRPVRAALLTLSLLLPLAGARAGADHDELPAVKGLPGTCATPAYPRESVIAGESGSVLLSLLVAADGHVEKIEVAQSSGFERLDRAAVDAMRPCRFTPAIVDGQPASAWGKMKVTFAPQQGLPVTPALAGVSQALHLRKFVAVMGHGCSSRAAEQADTVQAALLAWHQRNDSVAAHINAYKERYYEQVRRQSADPTTRDPQQRLEGELQSTTDQPVASAAAWLRALPPDERARYCERFSQQLNAGQLDLQSVVIRFPELEAGLASTSTASP